MGDAKTTRSLAHQLAEATRATNHVSLWLADMPDGYASGLEFDPDHSVILLDRDHTAEQLADEIAYQVDQLLRADRANSRMMLRSAEELEDGAAPACEPDTGRGARYRRRRPGVTETPGPFDELPSTEDSSSSARGLGSPTDVPWSILRGDLTCR